MTAPDPGVTAVLQVAFARIEATVAAALAGVPTRLADAQRASVTPQEAGVLIAAQQHLALHQQRLAQDFGAALRARVQGDLLAAGSQPGNPLRAAVIGWAMNRAIQKLTPDAGVARVLARHAAFGLSTAMADCRRRIVDDLQQRGIAATAMPPTATAATAGDAVGDPLDRQPQATCRLQQAALLDQLMRGETPSDWAPLLRAADIAAGRAAENAADLARDSDPHRDGDARLTAALRALNEGGFDPEVDAPPVAQNLIRRHRKALEQAASGPLDRMVIGIASDLFDAVVDDPQVPPPVASLLAPLQLPVLRVAMRDPAFFADRQHPVRRFIDRVASLGQARSDLDSDIGRGWLAGVGGLVQQIVKGDFHKPQLYERQLQALDRITAEAARAEVEAGAAGAAIKAHEAAWRHLSRLSADARTVMAPLPLPPFVQDFLAEPWCQLVAASHDLGDTAATEGWRRIAAELATSVLPKRGLADRRAFAASLPDLMASLHGGLDQIDWTPAQRRPFFDALMAAHAASMRAEPLAEATYEGVARQMARACYAPGEAAMAMAASGPTRSTTGVPLLPLHAPHLEPRFNGDEARRVGLVRDHDVAWTDGPAAAPSLRDALQVGLSYRLLLDAQWQPIRLTYLAPGRNFFMFSHGPRQRQSISMTARMVDRLCAASRFGGSEAAPLLDRATQRVRALAVSQGAA